MSWDWNANNTSLAIQGTGALASAWGQYETDKTRNKLAQDQLDYEKSKDAEATAKVDKANTDLEDAFNNSTMKKKKIDPITGLEIDTVV